MGIASPVAGEEFGGFREPNDLSQRVTGFSKPRWIAEAKSRIMNRVTSIARERGHDRHKVAQEALAYDVSGGSDRGDREMNPKKRSVGWFRIFRPLIEIQAKELRRSG